MAGNGDIVGYTFAVENLCIGHTVTAMRAHGIKVGAGGVDAIRMAAEKLGIDMSDQHSYDSADFPKPITGAQCVTELSEETDYPEALRKRTMGIIADERCGATGCGKWLVLGEKSPAGITLAGLLHRKYEVLQPIAGGVAHKLREWGLSHPEHIDEEDVKAAVATIPHDFRAYHFIPGTNVPEFHPTPLFDGDECYDCGQLWEDHTFRCAVCFDNVPALTVHRHEIVMRGQYPMFRLAKMSKKEDKQ